MNAKVAFWTACAALALVSSAAYGALVQRTFVASDGKDTDPCSINQPCRSFGIAIGKTLAGGEVIVRDSAGYGIVTINKSVSIIAPAGVYAGISVMSGQTGVAINGPNIVVVLHGLSINGVGAGSGTGIHFLQGARLRIKGCVVSNLSSSGIIQDAAGSEMVVLDTIVRDNIGAGVLVQTDASAVFDNFRAEHNAGDGVLVVAGSTIAYATIRRSVLSHNGGSGVFAEIPPSSAETDLFIEDSVVANNAGDGITVGGTATGLVRADVRRNSITGNGLSGVSTFTLASSGSPIARSMVTENGFGPTGAAGLTANGAAVFYASRNNFDARISFNITGGAVGVTYKDNSGFHSGSVPLAVSPF